jgi:ACS family D-galactonate transporter-like MFS transporter
MATSDATIDKLHVSNETETVAWKRWSILILLGLGAILAFASRTNLPQAQLDKSFVMQFHLSKTDLGVLNSVFFWSYMVLQIPMGWLVDRYGYKVPYAISFVFWCLGSAATGVVGSIGGLGATRLAVGAGEAVMMPASYRWIRNNFAETQSGLAVGIFMIGTKVGPAIGPLIAGYLMVAYGWQSMFLIIGLGGLLWLVPWMLLVSNDKPQAAQQAQGKRYKSAMPLSTIFASPLVWGTIIINFCYNYFVFYDMTWLPDYLKNNRHLSFQKERLFTFFSFMGIAIVALAAGWAADIMIKRGMDKVVVRKAFVIGGFVLACTEVLGATTTSVNVALTWTVISLSGLGLATANHLALCRLTLIPKPAVGIVTGVQMVSTALAGIAAPIVSGWLLDTTGGYTAPMQVIFVFLVIGALTTFFLLQERWAPKMPGEAGATA